MGYKVVTELAISSY